MANLIVGETSFQLIGVLRPLMVRIKKQDKSLADQLARAANRKRGKSTSARSFSLLRRSFTKLSSARTSSKSSQLSRTWST